MSETKTAIAGTLESMDCLVTVERGTGKVELEGTSVARFRSSMENTIRNVKSSMNAQDIDIRVQDRGALDITLEARVRAAIMRLQEVE